MAHLLGYARVSTTVALVAYGGAEQSALAAVLLYRLISFWGLIPVEGLCCLGSAPSGGPGGSSARRCPR
jgi:uncharacterized membrane protein YbhN (UPF0104 family)